MFQAATNMTCQCEKHEIFGGNLLTQNVTLAVDAMNPNVDWTLLGCLKFSLTCLFSMMIR